MTFRVFLGYIDQEPLIDILMSQRQNSTLRLTLCRPGGSSSCETALEAVQYCS